MGREGLSILVSRRAVLLENETFMAIDSHAQPGFFSEKTNTNISD